MGNELQLEVRPVSAADFALVGKIPSRWSQQYPRGEWFTISKKDLIATRIGAAPRVRFLLDGTPIVHRSHLPLLVGGGPYEEDEDVLAALTARWNGTGVQLRPWQARGSAFVADRQGALLLDEPRVGKTAQILGAHDLSDGPFWVVCPLAVKTHWIEWIGRRWPDKVPFVAESFSANVEAALKAEIVVIHPDVLGAWGLVGLGVGMLAIDEAHLYSNGRSRRSRAVMLLASRSHRVVCATGSALWNRPSGLYTMLCCATPGAWGTYEEFTARYASAVKGRYGIVTGGASHGAEFQARMTEVAIRRSWDDLGLDLPPITREVITVELSADQAWEIDLAVAAAREQGSAPALVRARRVLGTYKIGAAVAKVTALLQEGRSVVVWTWHKETARVICERIDLPVWVGCVTGNEDITVREATIARFRAADRPACLVSTIAVGQVGIDLSAATHAVFAELDWTPATIGQAEMRTYAPTRPMHVTYVVVDHPADRAVAEMLIAKAINGHALGLPVLAAGVDVLARAFGVSEGSASMERLRRVIGGAP